MPCGQLCPVQVRDGLRGGETDPEAAGLLVPGTICTVEAVEDPLQIRDFRDRVGDTQADTAVFSAEENPDLSVLRAVLDRVIRQNGTELGEQIPVSR